jgi:hypothetical protein
VIDVPFSRSYWVIPGEFLAGYYPEPRDEEGEEDQQELRALLACGIRTMIDLTEPNEQDWRRRPPPSYREAMQAIATSIDVGICFEQSSIRDTWAPSRLQMCQILDRIDRSIEEQKPVYLHCWGGRGRTGTVVGCFLMRHGLSSHGNVLGQIQGLRRDTPDHELPSPETSAQVELVLSWVAGE